MRSNNKSNNKSSTTMSTKPSKAKVAVWKKIVLVLGVIVCAIVVFAVSFVGAFVLIGQHDFSADTAELEDKIDTLEIENETLKEQIKDLQGDSSSSSSASSSASTQPASTPTPTAAKSSSSTSSTSGGSSSSGSSGSGTSSGSS